jgi:hypothetical protein
MSNPHEITLAEAATMTHAYQNATQFQGLTIAVKFDRIAYDEILVQPGCVAVRSYFSLDSMNALTLVLVGVDVNNNDLTNGKIMDGGEKCPIICDINSPLL